MTEQNNKQKTWGRNELTILGGSFTEDKLAAFLSWPQIKKLAFSIFESNNSIGFNCDFEATSEHPQSLERLRIFGSHGDLTIRRNGDLLHWWFVGPSGVTLPGGVDGDDFFTDAEPEACFLVPAEDEGDFMMLWGLRPAKETNWKGTERTKIFWEDRVARANLNYPVDDAERVCIRYRPLRRKGQLEFCWFLEITGCAGA